MGSTISTQLAQYLQPWDRCITRASGIAKYPIANPSPALLANRYYFSRPEWAREYFEACHRNETFEARWRAALGSWDGKVVVDIGCGPGNLYATLGGKPELPIGVDVSEKTLEMAQEMGYAPLLADAHDLPLKSGFADVVALNATLHHCDNMPRVLSEAARLVRPNGLLITDCDPQQSAWNFRGLGWWLWRLRLPVYRCIQRGGHRSIEQQRWCEASEVHHRPGYGVTPSLFHQVLRPLGFDVQVVPHNHTVGVQALKGDCGRAASKYRWAQRLSGIDPDSVEAALSLMCIAKKR
ncbi:class I SAM-dependent methyltransferase [Synechococcus sp. PCC 7336]|uniref:class I SAM-dependent methyltransferase n=1 Tax=Synechococcus sp. PCC 7336 TaxID=195250 RepID=UPI00034BA6A5|nr:class I SAM-dependent methyltransferase [Synechococcus sp. PCC 7336]